VRLIRKDKLPLIAFVTAYDEYAVRAFEMNAVGSTRGHGWLLDGRARPVSGSTHRGNCALIACRTSGHGRRR
jgi:hypothetical protein